MLDATGNEEGLPETSAAELMVDDVVYRISVSINGGGNWRRE